MIMSLILIGSVYLTSEYGNHHEIVVALSPTVPNRLNFSPYENSSFGIKILYPSDWKKIEDFRGSWFRNFNESVNMRMEIIPWNRSLDDLTSNQISLIEQQFPRQELIESNATTIGANYTGHKIVFTFPEEPRNLDVKFKEMKVWTINGSRGYIISYFTPTDPYDNYLPIAQKIIDSFRITPVGKK
jgi:serine/threonine-protein kinase